MLLASLLLLFLVAVALPAVPRHQKEALHDVQAQSVLPASFPFKGDEIFEGILHSPDEFAPGAFEAMAETQSSFLRSHPGYLTLPQNVSICRASGITKLKASLGVRTWQGVESYPPSRSVIV